MRRQVRRIAFMAFRLRMSVTMHYRAVLSPCVGVCAIDDDGLCAGCHRTGDEIARWPLMNDDARLRMMEQVLPQRAAQRDDP